MRKWRLFVGLSVLLLAVFSVGAMMAGARSEQPLAPSDALTKDALAYVEGNYQGKVERVVSSEALTLEEWVSVERSAGLAHATGTSADASTVVQGIVVEGDFFITGPVRPDGTRATSDYTQGRVVIAQDGMLLQVRFWNGSKAAAGETFGPAFESSSEG